MPIELIWDVPGEPSDLEAFLSRVADSCMELEGISGAYFSVRVVDSATMRVLNQQYRGVDAGTDVLSFPSVRYPKGTTARDNLRRLRLEYDPAVGAINLGDCALNLERAQEQAAELGHSVERELGYLVAHSAFHLMGYDHIGEADRRAMRAMEKRAMAALQLWRTPEGGKNMTEQELFAKACAVQPNAYAPYSGFKVGACILTEDGRSFCGCNFENASLGATICAERCAAGCAIAAGARRFTAIAIAAEKPAWPCGICRQVLREFAVDLGIPVIVGTVGGDFAVKSLGELLPESFGPEDLLKRGG